MPEIVRSRDVVLFKKGDHFNVTVSDPMAQGGWPGGQAVQWAPSSSDQFMVTYSDGLVAGFLLWGSDEPADKFTAISGHQAHYRFAVMLCGGCIFSTSSFERYTYASRISGPLVPIVYNPNDTLYVSLRGLLTKEDEWLESGDIRGSKAAYPSLGILGMVVQAPSSLTNQFITVQTV
jgi:hypothetical protein